MYHTIFNSHLQYGILCWGSTTATNLYRLQVLQNRAVRNMMRAPRYFRLDNHYLNLRILKTDDLYSLEVAKFMHCHRNHCLPDCFSSFFHERRSHPSHNLRSSNNFMYDIIRCRTARGQRSIRYHGPKIWNEIPISIRKTSKLLFKKQYKVHLFSRY